MSNKFKDIQENIRKEIQINNPIVDGIINCKKYEKANTKILWVLKEPYSDKNDWTYQSYLSIKDIESKITLQNENTLNYEVFRRILYVSYGLINKIEYSKIPYAEEKEVYSIGEEIAYINIKKIPGKSKSNDKEIKDAYMANEELLLKQIHEYEPDVLIFGNTLKYFDLEKLKRIGWDFSYENRKVLDKETNNTHFYITDNDRLCINAYHPSYWSVKRDIYCSEIIEAGLKWREIINNK